MEVQAREPFTVSEEKPSRRVLLGEVWTIFLPTMLNNVMTLLNECTNTLCLGHAGNDAELAAVGLGNMMQNCCALSLGIGLTSALDTFVSQAHGAGQHSLCVQYLQRSRVLCTLQLIWMIPLLWFSDSILVAVGQHPDVARHAASYNRVAAFGLFSQFQWQGILAYLRNVKMPQPAMWIAGSTCMLHIVWAVLFIVVFKW
ncbi:DTX33, partial [Symbiodinium natans]